MRRSTGLKYAEVSLATLRILDTLKLDSEVLHENH